MNAPPPRLTATQKAVAAALRAAGASDGLALDAATGRIAEADLIRWIGEYRAAVAAERAKWGWRAAGVKPRTREATDANETD